MLFTIDLDTLELIASATDRRRVSMVEAKRGDDTPFEVQFVRGGVAEELAESSVLTFGAKEEGEYDSDAVVLEDGFALSGSGSTAKYIASPSFNTEELNALFQIDADLANDPPFVDLMAEFTWAVGSGAPTSTRTFRFRVHNDVVRGDEGTPSAASTPDDEWVAHGHSQSLTTGQKEQVSANIATSSGHTSPSQILSTDGSGRTRARQFIALASTFNGSITVLDTGIVAFVGASASFSTTLSFEEAASSDRSVVIPDAEGTLPPLPAYSSLSAANAAEAAIGIVFWNTTSGKAQVTTATS